ncbi:bifunctional 2-polyprenyl-6-hydroxyphenol methylase/3-demethylubiquinol 3-O-methyltransferase UbiG [Pantoea sp. BAV 3049]|uniref:class I SAM-dependent methyltransferase n=1 Tax=Pantoea sp. BAV 3049 TaxID=2654188 RepID=UPI001E3897C0|nr:class I SAM-dependent methyltransferase [Pantoea sp. BAV 3049]
MNMKIAGGKTEDGIVVGNTYDKYGARNPIVKWMMKGFEDSLTQLVSLTNAKNIHEIGCGEGYWVTKWSQSGVAARGCDFSHQVIEIAQENAKSAGVSEDIFKAKSIYDLDSEQDSAELIVCCEVLEHLEDPLAGLEALQRVTTDYILLSVPKEPLWRVLNFVRGKYWSDLGNTPGHLQHWSKRSFIELVSRYFDVVQINTPLPWTMVLCRRK